MGSFSVFPAIARRQQEEERLDRQRAGREAAGQLSALGDLSVDPRVAENFPQQAALQERLTQQEIGTQRQKLFESLPPDQAQAVLRGQQGAKPKQLTQKERQSKDLNTVREISSAISFALNSKTDKEFARKWKFSTGKLVNLAKRGSIELDTGQDLSQVPTRQEAEQSLELLKQREQALDPSAAEKPFLDTGTQQDVAAALGETGRGSVGRAIEKKPAKFQKLMTEQLKRKGINITTVIGGKAKPTKKVLGEIQADIRFNESTIEQLGRMGDLDPSMFTFWAAGGEKLAVIGEKLGLSNEASRGLIASRQWIRSNGGVSVLRLLNSFSGKQLTDQERKFALKLIGDTESMSYTQYVTAVTAMKRIAQLELARAQSQLGGLNVPGAAGAPAAIAPQQPQAPAIAPQQAQAPAIAPQQAQQAQQATAPQSGGPLGGQFSTPEELLAAVVSGDLSKEEAVRVAKQKGFQ